MPEGLEAEIWRRALEALTGATITDVWCDERSVDPLAPLSLPGTVIEAVDRIGKVVVVVTSGPALGLHFGMTGRVEVHGTAPIERLEYSSGRDLDAWDRLRVWTDGAPRTSPPALRLNDPRRLGRVSIDPDLRHLGPDFLSLDRAGLQTALDGRRAAVKSVLLDQTAIAGLGNLCADEALWWAGIAPHRPAADLDDSERAALLTAIRRRMPIMLRRGGSTTGVLTPTLRSSSGPCPRDGAMLERSAIGGRTAVWCAEHQH